MTVRILTGDCRELLASVDDESVQCCVTSPPYWGLRDYGTTPLVFGGDPTCAHEWGTEGRIHKGGPHGDGVLVDGGRAVIEAQAAVKDYPTGAFCGMCGAWRGHLGLEPTPGLYVEHIVEVFRAVRRVLMPDATLWLNLGDCYATGAGKVGDAPGGGEQGARWRGDASKHDRRGSFREDRAQVGPMTQPNRLKIPGLKPKDLVGIPWRVAFALQADGWWLRSDIIWHKPNPMPESVTDRPTKSHEYLFLLTKSEQYYYDADAIAEPAVRAEELQWAGDASGLHSGESHVGQGSTRRFKKLKTPSGWKTGEGSHASLLGRHEPPAVETPSKVATSGNLARKPRPDAPEANGKNQAGSVPWEGLTRNKRDVWTIPTQPYSGAHFATFPAALIEPCILAGSRRDDTVLDPFGGAGTTGLVCDRLGRDAVLIELKPANVEMARDRIIHDAPMFARVETA